MKSYGCISWFHSFIGARGILFLIYFATLLSTCQCRSRLVLATSIFGNSKGKNEKKNEGPGNHPLAPKVIPPPPPPGIPQQPEEFQEKHHNEQQQNQPPPPPKAPILTPPPPPPPMQSYNTLPVEKNSSNVDYQKQETKLDFSESQEPQRGYDESQENLQLGDEVPMYPPYSDIPPQPHPEDGFWGSPPMYDNFMTQEHQNQQQMYYEGEIQHQLDDSVVREHDLIDQVRNCTALITTMQLQKELHLRQLEVLTERIVDVENKASSDRTTILEYQANCTELERQIAMQQQDLEDWESQCAEYAEQSEQKQGKIENLKDILKRRNFDLEELASSIENSSKSEQNKIKKRGLFNLFYNWLTKSKVEYKDENLQEQAKSALLRALQTERDSVEELETVAASLQQNNSAISEMVKSRDSIIDELNDRVAVFEEEKVVLKAALRQLQKEMKEEAPKTQKLVDDLQRSKKELAKVNAELQSLIESHEEEISALQIVVANKQNALNETLSNMTVIGQYIDKLEDRLATFAIARRDLDKREEKCKEIEESIANIECERKSLDKKVANFEVEHKELKSLLEQLAKERSKLSEENEKILNDKTAILLEDDFLRNETKSLKTEIEMLVKKEFELKAKTENLEEALKTIDFAAGNARKELETITSANSNLKEELEVECKIKTHLQNQLQEKEVEMKNLVEAKAAEFSKEQTQLKEELSAQTAQFNREKAEFIEKFDSQAANFAQQEQELIRKFDVQAAEFLSKKERLEKEMENQATAFMQEKSDLLRRKTFETNQNRTADDSVNGNARHETFVKRVVQSESRSIRPPMRPPPQRRSMRSPSKRGAPEKGYSSVSKYPISTQSQIPFRKIRKTFSKATGMHGFFNSKKMLSLLKAQQPLTKRRVLSKREYQTLQNPREEKNN